jgi:putative membrane protein
MKTQWTLISALVFALITAIFAVINVEPVQVNFLFTQTSTPLILVILSSTLLGGLIVGLIGIIRQYKQQRTIRQLTKELAEARASIHNPIFSNEPQAPDEPNTPLPDSEG